MTRHAKHALAAGLLTAASLGLTSTSHAIVYAEPADAGQTLGTAQATGTDATTALSAITGTFNGASDADLYLLTISTPTSFSASTVNTLTNTGGQDTALFLFSATGTAIATNDDANGTTFDAALPAGNTLYANLAAGTYYLGISESGNEPVNTPNQLLFAGYPGGDTTAVRGAAGGLNPTTLANFNSNEFDGGTGTYQIDLTGAATAAAVPEPSTWAALALATLATLAAARRRSVA